MHSETASGSGKCPPLFWYSSLSIFLSLSLSEFRLEIIQIVSIRTSNIQLAFHIFFFSLFLLLLVSVTPLNGNYQMLLLLFIHKVSGIHLIKCLKKMYFARHF